MANLKQVDCSQEILGRGGFGTVFKGRFDNKDVAVKQVLTADVNDGEEKFLTQHRHPNILKLFHTEKYELFRQVSVAI